MKPSPPTNNTRHDSTSAVFELCLNMGDSALILAQQNSKWCGHAPILEEDIAFANIALDLIGQARFWLDLAGKIEADAGLSSVKGERNTRDADALAYGRDAIEFRNHLITERPHPDFAHALMRQFLFDCWHEARLGGLCQSAHNAIALIAQKSLVEVRYHLERSRNLIIRLGDGSEESHERMQSALDALWPYFGGVFEDSAGDQVLAEGKVAPLPSTHESKVRGALEADFKAAALSLPQSEHWQRGARQGHHGEHFGLILAEMQFLERAYPGLEW